MTIFVVKKLTPIATKTATIHLTAELPDSLAASSEEASGGEPDAEEGTASIGSGDSEFDMGISSKIKRGEECCLRMCSQREPSA